MSHYSVLVIGGNVEEQLQPYHEFECTGTDDQYVQEIDQTEEARETFAEDTETRYRDAEGNLHSPYDDEGNYLPEFLREPTPEEEEKHGKMIGSGGNGEIHWVSSDWHDGRGYRAKVFQTPEGLTKVEVPTGDVQTFAEFCADYYGHPIVPFGQQPNFVQDEELRTSNHKYGYTIVDESGNVVKTVDRSNPSAKWDWYSVGGRWNGFFKLKPMTVGVVGEPGIQSMNSDYEPPAEDRADVLMKGDIDVEGMRDEAGEKAADRWDRFHAIIAGLPAPFTWKQAQERHRTGEVDEDGDPKVDWQAARDEFHGQPAVKALRSSEDRDAFWWDVDDFMVTREEFVQQARDYAVCTFAVVRDGKWYERGKMGWWGSVSDAKDKDEWTRQFTELFDSLPDDTLLTICDCHI